MRIKLFIMIIIFSFASNSHAACHGKMVNFFSDVCWKCMLPITIMGAKLGDGRDTPNPKNMFCHCTKKLGIPMIGMPVSYWEAVKIVEVTQTPYCMVSLGGIQLMQDQSKSGTISGTSGVYSGFYNVHMYDFPIWSILGTILDLPCHTQGIFDIAYMSELDPVWDDEELAALMHPESLAYKGMLTEMSCIFDCLKAQAGFAIDSNPWCGGCTGNLVPSIGLVNHHVGYNNSAKNVTFRMLNHLHHAGTMPLTSTKEAMCGDKYHPVIKKSQYKTQMIHPIAVTKGSIPCEPVGYDSDNIFSILNTGFNGDLSITKPTEYPVKGEFFSYIIWRKRNCCAEIGY